MSGDPGTTSSEERPSWWRRVPEPLWWSVLPVLAGFVVAWPRLGTSADGSCTYLDLADLASGGLAVALVLLGVVAQARREPPRRCQPQVMMALVVFLGGLGIYHLLTGLGRIGGACG